MRNWDRGPYCNIRCSECWRVLNDYGRQPRYSVRDTQRTRPHERAPFDLDQPQYTNDEPEEAT
jgi:hypothetical protein